jgi:hypothetical protein
MVIKEIKARRRKKEREKAGSKAGRKSRSLTPIRKRRDWVRDDSGGGVAKEAIGSGGSGCDALEKGQWFWDESGWWCGERRGWLGMKLTGFLLAEFVLGLL